MIYLVYPSRGSTGERMKKTYLLLLLTLATPAPVFPQFFPYNVAKKTLKNQLDVVVIETPEFKHVLSYNTLVLAGARNEIEAGKTGLAHLFEHILFRHRWKGEANGYDHAINRIGAFNNGWTDFDVTYYHPLTFTSRLFPHQGEPGLPQLEADRFQHLDFDEGIFKTEAGAVFGEYRRGASNPGLKIRERLLSLMFPEHSYGHTTIGYLEDVKDMPNEHQAALEFYRTYYRPNNVVLIVSGDVRSEQIFSLAEELYGNWKPAPLPSIPVQGAAPGPKREHLTWEADVPPRISYAYRMPAFQPASVEGAVGQLLPELLAGETSPLYQLLRYEKKTASQLSVYSGGYESFDPRHLALSSTLFKDQYRAKGTVYLDHVIDDMKNAFEALQNFSQVPNASKTLEELKGKYRYDLLAMLDSPSNIAMQFAWYYRFQRSPKVLDLLADAIQALQPADIDAFASRHFLEKNRVIVTMAPAEKQ